MSLIWRPWRARYSNAVAGLRVAGRTDRRTDLRILVGAVGTGAHAESDIGRRVAGGLGGAGGQRAGAGVGAGATHRDAGEHLLRLTVALVTGDLGLDLRDEGGRLIGESANLGTLGVVQGAAVLAVGGSSVRDFVQAGTDGLVPLAQAL
jgi:hypothetical protein